MSWSERLEQIISGKRPGAVVAKGAKHPLATLATAEGGRFQKKNSKTPLRVYRYRLRDNPDSWLVLIAPGSDLEQAANGLRQRFGERLLDVRAYTAGKKV